MADRTIRWIHDQKAQSPDKPFFIYYAPGASHAPAPRARRRGPTSTRASSTRAGTSSARRRSPGRSGSGVIPANAKLTPRDPAFPAWDSVPPELKKFYARQMEVFAGFQENCDHEIGRVVQSIEDLGLADNTLILYIWGDNGSSMEGTETGTFNELTTINGSRSARRVSSSS